MKTTACKSCGAYLGAAVLSSLALWWAYGRYWADVLCWINANQALAGWVQAVGSIAAVVGTWWATKHQLGVAERVRQRDAANRDLDMNRACLKAAATAHRLLNRYAFEYRNHARTRRLPDMGRTEQALGVARVLLAKDLPGDALVAMIDCVTALGILLALMQMLHRGESWDTELLRLMHARQLSAHTRWTLRRLVKQAEETAAQLQ